MPVFRLPEEHLFPDPELAREDGLLAVGGDLEPRRLLLAYSMGIFPWYSEGLPILWHSPDPRFVLFLDELKVSRSLRKVIARRGFELKMDTAFEAVMDGCARSPRPGQRGTWITREMRRGYLRLHRMGFAHSTEAWQDGQLVAGLYGVALGRIYFGESMFTTVSDASKVAFVALCHQLMAWGYDLVDSQVYTDHLARFGAEEIPRSEYLEALRDRLPYRGQVGKWAFDPEVLESFWQSRVAPRGDEGAG